MLLRKIEKEFTVVIVKLSTFEAEPSVDPEGPAVVNVRKSSLNVHISEKNFSCCGKLVKLAFSYLQNICLQSN